MYSREGSLCSPPARLGRKYWVLLKVSKMSFEVVYAAKNNYFILRAQGAHIADCYFGKVNFPRLSTIHISNSNLKTTF